MEMLNEIIRGLRDRKISVSEISRLSGVARPTIIDIRDRATRNPRFQTVMALHRVLYDLGVLTSKTPHNRAGSAPTKRRHRGRTRPSAAPGVTPIPAAGESQSTSRGAQTAEEGAHNPTSSADPVITHARELSA